MYSAKHESRGKPENAFVSLQNESTKRESKGLTV